MQSGHQYLLEHSLNNRVVLPVLFIFFIVIGLVLLFRIPDSFLPDEDQGRMFVLLDGPPSSSLQLTLEKIKKVEDFFLDEVGDAVQGMFAAAGFSFAGSGQNAGIAFVNLKAWKERGEESNVFMIQEKAGRSLSGIRDARVIPIVPPPVSALGNAGGFEFKIVDRQGRENEALTNAMNQFLEQANGAPS